MGIEAYFIDITSLAGLVIVVSGFLNGKILGFDGLAASVTSWAVAIVLAWSGHLLGIGFMGAVEGAASVTLYGAGVALVANKIFEVEWVKTALEAFKLKTKKAKRE